MLRQIAVILGLMAVSLGCISGQAHAMNLLIAVGNPQIQLVKAENGTLIVIQQVEEKAVKVSSVEPAAGVQDIKTSKAK